MAKIINFDSKAASLGKKVIEQLVKDLRSLDPEKVSSLFLHIGLTNEDGNRANYSVDMNLDFNDFGYLDAYLTHLKDRLIHEYVLSEGDVGQDEISDMISDFKIPEDDNPDVE